MTTNGHPTPRRRRATFLRHRERFGSIATEKRTI